MSRPTDSDASLRCTNDGCTRRWTCDFGRRLCSECDARQHASHMRKSGTLPLREPARPFCEPSEPDEEYVHD